MHGNGTYRNIQQLLNMEMSLKSLLYFRRERDENSCGKDLHRPPRQSELQSK